MRLLRDTRACRGEITPGESHSVHARRAGNRPTSLRQQADQIVILSESEESRINFSTDPAQRNGPEMFRFTQHYSADEMNSKAVGASVYNLSMKQACAF